VAEFALGKIKYYNDIKNDDAFFLERIAQLKEAPRKGGHL